MASRWGYRKLLRSVQHVFKQDTFAVQNARQQLREEFFKNKDVKDPNALNMMIRGIEEVDEMLRFNIVQGQMNAAGNFGTYLFHFIHHYSIHLTNHSSIIPYLNHHSFSAVELSPEHTVTIEANQDDPHGPELALADASLLGRAQDIKIVKTKGTKIPYTEVE